VDKLGKARLAGSLADGTRFTHSSAMTLQSRLPLYVPLYGGRGAIIGWIDFAGSQQSLSGTLDWVKPAGVAKSIPGGFAIRTSMTGSSYTQPAQGQSVLSMSRAQLTISGSDFDEPFSHSLTAVSPIIMTAPGVTVKFAPQTGTYRGKLANSSAPISFSGVVLQNSGTGYGYFLAGASCVLVQIIPLP